MADLISYSTQCLLEVLVSGFTHDHHFKFERIRAFDIVYYLFIVSTTPILPSFLPTLSVSLLFTFPTGKVLAWGKNSISAF